MFPRIWHKEGQPVGRVVIDDSINTVVSQLLELLPISEFTPDLEAVLRDSWQPGRTFGEAFARMMTALLGGHGLILLDPLDPRLKEIGRPPLYSRARRVHMKLATAIEARSQRLVEAGYHAQVTPSENSFPLFLHDATARDMPWFALPAGK